VDGGQCREVRTTWVPVADVSAFEHSKARDVELRMETLAACRVALIPSVNIGPHVAAYRDWINTQVTHSFGSKTRRIGRQLCNAPRPCATNPEWFDVLDDPQSEAFPVGE